VPVYLEKPKKDLNELLEPLLLGGCRQHSLSTTSWNGGRLHVSHAAIEKGLILSI
jgi:hypothetical protein